MNSQPTASYTSSVSPSVSCLQGLDPALAKGPIYTACRVVLPLIDAIVEKLPACQVTSIERCTAPNNLPGQPTVYTILDNCLFQLPRVPSEAPPVIVQAILYQNTCDYGCMLFQALAEEYLHQNSHDILTCFVKPVPSIVLHWLKHDAELELCRHTVLRILDRTEQSPSMIVDPSIPQYGRPLSARLITETQYRESFVEILPTGAWYRESSKEDRDHVYKVAADGIYWDAALKCAREELSGKNFDHLSEDNVQEAVVRLKGKLDLLREKVLEPITQAYD